MRSFSAKCVLLLIPLFMAGTVAANPISPLDSAGACEMYKDLADVDEDSIDCSPGPNFDVCGAYEWDQKVYKQGPEVDPVIEDYQAHYEACASSNPDGDFDVSHQEGYCVLGNSTHGTDLVEEGTVANVAPYLHDTESL